MVAGIARARRKDSSLQFLVYGDEKLIRDELGKHGKLTSAVTVCHTPESIGASEKHTMLITQPYHGIGGRTPGSGWPGSTARNTTNVDAIMSCSAPRRLTWPR